MSTYAGDPRYNHCWKCNASISEATVTWSLNKYGAALCYNCQPRKIEEVVKKWEEKQKTASGIGLGERRANDY